MSYKFLIAILFLAATAHSEEPEASAPPIATHRVLPAQAAVDRGLKYIQTYGMKWKEERKCASCHHGPMMVWTCAEARARGFRINDSALAEMTAWTFSDKDEAKVLPSPDTIDIGVPYLLLGARSLPEEIHPAPALTKRFVEHILALQGPDGSWMAGAQPPVTPTVEAATLYARLSLESPPEGSVPDPAELKSKVEKADAWLKANAPTDENQPQNLRLWLESLSRKSEEKSPLEMKILGQQKEDGGWSQTPELPSDAYATGQTLYVLNIAGLGVDDPAVARGLKFLMDTQTEEGSWPMTSRPGPRTIKNLEPITFSAAGWATLALMRFVKPDEARQG